MTLSMRTAEELDLDLELLLILAEEAHGNPKNVTNNTTNQPW